jgi:hypothetical protein
MALVSIVIPTRNRATHLPRTLRAVHSQEGVELEVVVVDDASGDSTPELVAASPDKRIVYVRHDIASGVSAARNSGIAAARGEWVAFLDDDDVWAPDKLWLQLAAAEQERADWVYGGDVNVDDDLRVLSGGPPHDPDAVMKLLPRWNPLSSGGSNVMVRSAALAEVGGFDTTLRRTEDWDLWLRLARRGRPAWVNEPLVAYRFHAGNVIGETASIVDEPRRLAARYGIPVDLPAMHRRAAWVALRGGRRRLAIRHYLRAVAGGDFQSLGRALFALTHPAVGTDRLFDRLGRDPAWVARAERWLQAFAARETAAS